MKSLHGNEVLNITTWKGNYNGLQAVKVIIHEIWWFTYILSFGILIDELNLTAICPEIVAVLSW